MEDGLPDYQFYATEATTAKAGWVADYLPDISQNNLIMLDVDDLEDVEAMKAAFMAAGVDLENTHALNQITFENIKIYLSESRAKSSPFSTLSQEEFQEGAMEAAEQGIYNMTWLPTDINVITVDLEQTPREMAEEFTGLPAEHFTHLPGEQKDYRPVIPMHEAAHGVDIGFHVMDINHFGPSTNVLYETGADQRFINGYIQAMADGHDLHPAIPSIMTDFRAANMLGHYSIFEQKTFVEQVTPFVTEKELESMDVFIQDHATHSFINPDGGLPDFDEIVSLEKTHGMARVNGLLNVTSGYTLMAEDVSSYLDTGEMPERTQEFFSDPLDFVLARGDVSRVATYGRFGSDTEEKIAALVALNDQGAFDGDENEKAYADKVIGFFDRTAPEFMAELRAENKFAGQGGALEILTNAMKPVLDEHREEHAYAPPEYASGKPTSEQFNATRTADAAGRDLFSTFDDLEGETPDLAEFPDLPKPWESTP